MNHPRYQVYTRAEHHISQRDIDEDAVKIITRLQRSGHSAYIVGGGVRDLVLNKQPKDFDIATDATPRKIKNLFSNSRIIGRRFKLVHIYFRGGKFIEVATFRDTQEKSQELGEDPLNSDNEFGTESTDAIRRDITMNALFLDPTTMEIIDYVEGFADLKSKIARVIGDPDVRFAEDPVRLIRVIRHAIRSGSEIEPKTYASIRRNADKITLSSQVRVYEEIKKDLLGGYALDTLWLLAETGVLTPLLPPLSEHRNALFKLGTSFTESFRLIDEQNRGESKLDLSLVLALLVFFLKHPLSDTTECAARFENADEIIDHGRSLFSSLQVTRKEREYYELLLISWLKISQTKDRGKLKLTLHQSVQNDIRLLLMITESVDLPYFNLHFSKPIQKSKPKHKGR